MVKTDTSPEIQEIHDQMMRQLSETQRFMRGLSLTRLCREICLEGLRERHLHADEQQLKKLFFGLLYPPSQKHVKVT